MTRRARQIAIASIAALVALAAIVAAPAPTQAQSEEQSSGKIIARRTADDRIEFGWQTPSGARVFPRQRYFPAGATVGRWLRSSPVEVDGAAIGRINARLRAGGRIEFAFTPTDGERILPPSRYFPHNARIGRWLSSTTITIGTPAATTDYVAISAGFAYACAIRAGSGEITCWGSNSDDYGRYIGTTDAPEGSYSTVSANSWHACAIRAGSGEIACWGGNSSGQTDAPPGSFSAVDADSYLSCAIRNTGEIECWGGGISSAREIIATPEGSYTAVSTAPGHACAIRAGSGEIACWGTNTFGQLDAPPGSYTAISADTRHTCAIGASDGAIECWGYTVIHPYDEETKKHQPTETGQLDAPPGSYTAVSTGGDENCAIRASDGAIECWGWSGRIAAEAPDGSFTAVSVGGGYACAIRDDRTIECWGQNNHGQATPPAE